MKVLVTGGYGQIGSHITELLLQRGDEVLIVDNLTTGREVHLDEHPRLSVHKVSIADKDAMSEIFARFQPETVVHTAASYKDPNDWYNDTLTNCVGGATVIDLSVQHKVQRFIYFQTALCYGLHPQENPITLSHPKDPSGSSYAISKTANEDYLQLSGLDYVTFRLANVIGPRNMAGALPIFYQRLKDKKPCFVTNARRDFVYVKDLAKTVIRACDGVGSGTYHFSSGKDVAIIDLYNCVTKAMGLSEVPVPDIREPGKDDAFSILLDPGRTFKDFGTIEFTALEEIVSDAVSYYEQYGTMGEYTHLKLAKD